MIKYAVALVLIAAAGVAGAFAGNSGPLGVALTFKRSQPLTFEPTYRLNGWRPSAIDIASERLVYDFRSGTDGVNPLSPLLLERSGNLIGSTFAGGALTNGAGTIYKLVASGPSSYTEKIIHRFQVSDGAAPAGNLVVGGDGAIYGTTYSGGAFDGGTAFKLTPTVSGYIESVLYNFGGTGDGASPLSGLVADPSGNFYGTTNSGGSANRGTVFRLSPNGHGYSETFLYSFLGAPDGANPIAPLVADAAGALYGTTSQSGPNGLGTVFKLTPSGSGYSESLVYAFQGGVDAANPEGGLVGDSSGDFFGTANSGGSSGKGAVFELSPSGNGFSESVLYSFIGGADGAAPYAGMVRDSAGNLFGVAGGDGIPLDPGTVFELVHAAGGFTEATIHRFSGGPDGNNPFAGLTLGTFGALYGTTSGPNCGPNSCGQSSGTAFKIIPNGHYYRESVIHSFHGQADGANPVAPLISDQMGKLYGTTYGGGASGQGTVFCLTPVSGGFKESILYRFQGAPDGANPAAGLIMDGSGALYGTTVSGGDFTFENTDGTVFKLTPSGTGYAESILYRFKGRNDGLNPYSTLIMDGTGALYGTTSRGGAVGAGTVFKLTPKRLGYSYGVLHSFGLTRGDGVFPFAGLVADSSGDLYGTTDRGGASNLGAVFKLIPQAGGYSESVLYGFQGRYDGHHPVAALIIDSSGSLYGTTSAEAGKYHGTVFKLTPSGGGYIETVLHFFTNPTDGSNPIAALVENSGGDLFGTTSSGGGSQGIVFRLIPAGNSYDERILHRFSGGTDGSNPSASLLIDNKGELYGTTTNGGSIGVGTVFKIVP